MTCRTCGRRLIPREEWLRLPTNQRKNLSRRAAEAGADDLCRRDYRLRERDHDLAYLGDWWNDRGIMRPTERRRA